MQRPVVVLTMAVLLGCTPEPDENVSDSQVSDRIFPHFSQNDRDRRLAILKGRSSFLCNIPIGSLIDWSASGGPAVVPADESASDLPVVAVVVISHAARTARIKYNAGELDAQIFTTGYGLHFVTKPDGDGAPDLLTIYAFPGGTGQSPTGVSHFAAAWSLHDANVTGRPLVHQYYGSCH